MASVSFEARPGLRWFVLNLAAVGAALTISSDVADARHHRVHYIRTAHVSHHARAEGYSPPFSSIVVDGNSAQVLHATNPDAMRHPASLTKIMTLYLLFERLEAGKIKLDTPLKVSEHASEQAPTKLGLKPGQTIPVEDAIKGVVTKSANDAAAVIAENLGGSEDEFAKLMTQKARALGMSRTTYVNASGLPDDDQLTTARDQALLGRAIQERFPRYYKYFSLPSFVYHGVAIRNHDHLLGSVEGVDGIKTGFTRDSGFNLVTSIHRDGRYMVAVVLGGRSVSERDGQMRQLISEHIKEASLRRTSPAVAERVEQHEAAQPVAFAKTPVAAAHVEPASPPAPALAPATTATVDAHAKTGTNDPIRPLLVRTVTFRTVPTATAALAPMPALVPVTAPASVHAQPPSQPAVPATEMASADPAQVGVAAPAKSDPIKSDFAPFERAAKVEAPKVEAAKIEPAKVDAPKIEAAKAEPPKVAPPKAEPPKVEIAKVEVPKPAPVIAATVVPLPTVLAHAHGGWMIQIGAFDGEDEAKQHLSAAQSKAPHPLAAADPFTERVQKGDKSLYRARFAGFDKATAELACKELKRSDFECMALKN
jgi:D-alanyl-D-alanine carboxypeptidase